MARIRWIDEDEATGELAELYTRIGPQSPMGVVPDIIKKMSLRPDFVQAIAGAAQLHFTDGALSCAQHEMIPSYVSALNRCHY